MKYFIAVMCLVFVLVASSYAGTMTMNDRAIQVQAVQHCMDYLYSRGATDMKLQSSPSVYDDEKMMVVFNTTIRHVGYESYETCYCTIEFVNNRFTWKVQC